MAKRRRKTTTWRNKSDFRFELANYSGKGEFVGMGAKLEVGDDLRLYVTDDIEFVGVDDLVRELRENDAEPAVVEVNSLGGAVHMAMQLFNAMVDRPGQTEVHITGIAASSGVIIASAGDRIIAHENTSVMVHPANVSVLWADASLLEFALEMVNKGTDQIIDLLAARSGQKTEKIYDLVWDKNGQGTTLTAKEALDLGLVDEVRETPTKNRNQVPESVLAQARSQAAIAIAKARSTTKDV